MVKKNHKYYNFLILLDIYSKFPWKDIKVRFHNFLCIARKAVMKKGADAPLPFEIAISSVISYVVAAFFLPTNLLINGQNKSNKAKEVMPPTK